MIKSILVASVGMFLATSAMAQDCSAGPNCRKASADGQRYLQSYGTRYNGPAVHASAMKAFCTNKVGEAVSLACAREMTATGQPACATLAKRQQAEHLRVANQAKSTVGATASHENWRSTCGF